MQDCELRSSRSRKCKAAVALGRTNIWSSVKPAPRVVEPVASVEALQAAWNRYRARAERIVKTCVTDEKQAKEVSTVKKHVDSLEAMRKSVA